MGQLVDGVWHEKWTIPRSASGSFQRNDAAFRATIGPDSPHAPEAGRYHLYLAHACPWCHRVAIVRKLKGLESVIPVSYVHPLMLEGGWRFEADGVHHDHQFGASFMHEIYTRADPSHTGRVTVPVLWDTERATIVNNESSELIRMFDAFDHLAEHPAATLYPEAHRAEIDALNEEVYHHVNNGVYKCGFAGTQASYEAAFAELFRVLDSLEARLEGRDTLVGDQLTEADVRLWVTLIRFDAVYVGHFKCNLRRIADYPNLSRYVRALWQVPAFRETTRHDEIKNHYYASHRSINPTGIVPAGPALDLEIP